MLLPNLQNQFLGLPKPKMTYSNLLLILIYVVQPLSADLIMKEIPANIIVATQSNFFYKNIIIYNSLL